MLLALSVSTADAATQCRLVASAPIPVTMMGWRPTIPAQLNGHATRLLVDTGAFFDALSPAEATQFNLPLSPAPHGFYVVGGLGNVFPKIATVKSLRVGPLSFPGNARFLVLANDLGNGISGALGQNLYRVLDVEFDFANGVMRFFKVTNGGRQPLAYWANTTGQSVSMLALEARDRYSTHLLTTVQVNGHAVNAILDTGATTSMLSLAAAKLVGVPPGSAGMTAVGPSGKLWNAPIDEIDLGDNEKIEHTHILVEDGNFAFGPGVWMFIGADFFLSHRVYLATSQSTLYFTYNGGPVFDLDPAHAAQDSTRATATAGLPPGTPADADADALVRRALVHANRLEFQQALAELTQACRLAPQNADYRYQRAVVYWRVGQPGPALEDFAAAIKLDPNDYRALLWRTELRLVMQTQHKPDPSSHDDPRIVPSSVDRPAPTNAKPDHSATSGSPDPKVIDDSKADLDAVDRLAPAEDDLRLTLGRVYEDIGRFAQAVRQYDLWINYHPGKPEDAAHDYASALRINPKMPTSLYGRGLAELRLGEKTQGQADLAAAAKLDKGVAQRFAKMGLAP